MTSDRGQAVAAALALFLAAGCSSETPVQPDAGFSAAPTSVDAGTLVRFRVNVNDAGPAFLRYGPYGMQVAGDGTVTWKAELPLFDGALDVHWAVGSSASDGGVVGTIRVLDGRRPPALLRSGFEIPAGHAQLRVLDLDGDGVDEALVGGRTGLYALGRSDAGYAQSWMLPFPPGVGQVEAIAAADLDGDHRAEIAFSQGQLLVVLDGVSRRQRAMVDLGVGDRCADLAIADLDRDGTAEVICLDTQPYFGSAPGEGRVRVFDALTLAPRWESAVQLLGESLAIGNVDLDAPLEVVTSAGLVFDGASHDPQWDRGQSFGEVIAVGDLDGDGVSEIVGVEKVVAIHGFDAVRQVQVFQEPVVDVDSVLAVDLDGDGRAEILTGDGQWGEVKAYSYLPASSSLALQWHLSSMDHGVPALGVGDLNGDHAYDIVWGSGWTSSGPDKLAVATKGQSGIGLVWMPSDPFQLDGPYLGARKAQVSPGRTAVLFDVPHTNSGHAGTRLVALDAVSGEWANTPDLGFNWIGGGALEVADVGGDGIDEAFLGTGDWQSGYVASWNYALGVPGAALASEMVVGLARGDLNGDGHPDLVGISGEGRVQAWDPHQGGEIWASPQLDGFGQAVAVADLDGDGTQEIIALAEQRLYVFRRTSPTTYVEAASIRVKGGFDLVVADVAGKRSPEVLVLRAESVTRSTVSRFSSMLQPAGEFELDQPAQALTVEDLGPGRRNLVVAIGDVGFPYSDLVPHLRGIDPVSGAEVWRSPNLWSHAMRGSVSYLDLGDGRRTLAFGTTLGMYVVR